MIQFKLHPTIKNAFQLKAEQWLPRPIDEVFQYFSDAYRLEELTPSFLHFHVVTPRPIPIAAGTVIDYRLRLHGIPIRWRSEISEWQPPFRFVDRQLIGPYRLCIICILLNHSTAAHAFVISSIMPFREAD